VRFSSLKSSLNAPSSTARSRLLPLALALAVSSAIPCAFASEPVASAIHIQAQPLGAALSQLAQQTSLQVFYSPQLVAGKQAPAVNGNLSPEQALRELLQGSGLNYQLNGDAVTLSPAATVSASDGSGPLELGPVDVKVVGNWLGDANSEVVQNHPGARTVVRREAMVEQGAMTVGDVLKTIPGVQVQESNGTGGSDISLNVGVRGPMTPRRYSARCRVSCRWRSETAPMAVRKSFRQNNFRLDSGFFRVLRLLDQLQLVCINKRNHLRSTGQDST